MLCQLLERTRADLLTLLAAGYGATRSWLRTVLTNLAWVASLSQKLALMTTTAPHEWIAMLMGQRVKSLMAIKKALIEFSAKSCAAPVALPDVPVVGIGQIWTCSECGAEKESKQALAAHAAREHKVLREARRRVVAAYCLICPRRFNKRTKCIDHLHEKAPICRADVLLFLPISSEEEVEAANDTQREREVANRKRCEAHNYTGLLTSGGGATEEVRDTV